MPYYDFRNLLSVWFSVDEKVHIIIIFITWSQQNGLNTFGLVIIWRGWLVLSDRTFDLSF